MEYKGKEIVVLMHTKQTDPVRAAYDLNDQVSALQQAVIVLRAALEGLCMCLRNDRGAWIEFNEHYELAQQVLAATHEVFQTEKEKDL